MPELPSFTAATFGGSQGSLGTSNYLVDPDVQTMLRVREGDEDAFARLVATHQSRLVRLLAHLSGDSEIAEDLAQEVFLRIYRARGRYEPTARFTTYMFRIANNVALNSKRSKSRRKERVVTDGSSTSAIGSPIYRATENSNMMPARRAASVEVQAVVQDAVQRLPDRQRMALLLHKFEEISYADIAMTMEMTTSAVKSLLSRARESLRAELDRFMGETPVAIARRVKPSTGDSSSYDPTLVGGAASLDDSISPPDS